MWVALQPFNFLGVDYAREQVIPQARVRGRTAGLRARAADALCLYVEDPPGWDPYGEPAALVRELPRGWRLSEDGRALKRSTVAGSPPPRRQARKKRPEAPPPP